jgi:hypothetical protein
LPKKWKIRLVAENTLILADIKTLFLKPLFPNFPVFKTCALAFLLLFLFEACANIVPPSGGEKDTTPPVLLSINPPDSSLHKKVSKIELHFNKFMVVQDLQSNMQLSPLIDINPTVLSYGKRVEIKIPDSLLLEHTTYRLNLGNALVDNRESTPYKNFVYIFSTGAYFDSLGLQGKVFDAATGIPDSTATIMLYPEAAGDSAVLRKKPLYAQKTNGAGNFSFSLLPQKAFIAYAVQDDNNNNIYDFGTEKIDFYDRHLIPSMNQDSFFVFNVFKETIDTSFLESPVDSTGTGISKAAARFRKNQPKDKAPYKVNADTGSRDKRTFELTGPLTVDLNTPLSELDSSKIYLSYDDSGTDVQAIQHLTADSAKITIHTKWLDNTVYTLRLVKGWAKDTSGTELPPGKYIFRTKRAEDYSSLKIHIDPAYVGEKYLLYVYREKDSVYQKPVQNSVVEIPLLQPGTYNMRIIVDENHNGKWDSGDLFKRKHAEKVIPYPQSMVMKAGWENEVDFKKQDGNIKPPAESQEGAFSERAKGKK